MGIQNKFRRGATWSELPGWEWHAVQFLQTFFGMETRLTNLYVSLHSFLPQMLRQTLAQIFLWTCKTNWEGVPHDPIFRGDETQLSQFWRTFFSMETRLTNLYAALRAFLPQMVRQTLAQIFLWACKTNWEGVQCDPIFREGGWHAIQFLRIFVTVETNHYVPLHASLPKILIQTLLQKKNPSSR